MPFCFGRIRCGDVIRHSELPKTNIAIIRTFVELRRYAMSYSELILGLLFLYLIIFYS